MKKIKLTQEKYALVDDEDYDFLSAWKWYAYKNENENTWYAGRNIGKRPNQRRVSMHRIISKVTSSNILVDHKDRNGLNNQRLNLRICDKSQNRQNSKKRSNNTSGYIGVTWRKDSNTWRVQITVRGEHLRIGGFTNPKDAAQVYNELASFHFGEFAVLNEDV
jgi:hypothetical protein